MKILFVSSGNSESGISPIVKAQGVSLQPHLTLEYFTISKKGILGYLSYIIKLRKHLKYNSVDIIHAHYGLSGIVAFLARRKHKLIVSYMGTDLFGTKKANGKLFFGSMIFVFVNKVLAYFFNSLSIVKSQEMSYLLYKATPKKIIPNGVNMELFKPLDKSGSRKKLKISEKEKIVLFASNPSRMVKNFKMAKAAFEKANIPDKKLIIASGLDQKELPLYYNAADVLILSSFHEGSPNVVKEAVACNCPVVSTNVGDVEALFGESDACTIVDYSVDNMAKALEFYLLKPHKTNGRNQIPHLADTKIAHEIFELYSTILKADN